jgi:hypothetical protein
LGEKFLFKYNKFKNAPEKKKESLQVDLKEEIGGTWSMRINGFYRRRWGVIYVNRKSPKHDWNIFFDFGFTCKVKQRHIKETYSGASRMKFTSVRCDEEGEGQKDTENDHRKLPPTNQFLT